ncbi:DNA protecting protein DprA [Candidatus Woesebacteria bacterium RIFCSPHIGHO2_02_FULL_38_9]|uniref:DNA protecting protein DprA n=1 Tax=Candidatus Woesebacteria bacterium RIFCSPHIGHO2_01_FULL_39_28 TaxID=1802496 RepID=A0A1F7YFV7_9BACT|nr:MAG: DNA protecting protein DprA [Candidatus Woesebacteria bacterium RIFCSPHIGHO2_01_FULL_39_28]OGM35328.1 MAG: DNA protecting protein DprA [Candidatus Woesebacteria bacterium RIFCSPHIGHO2_02_FULL_38_9]OGM58552.1 MAG: DNA protecting protein DprA [Candidatus Woesebacteria bacterium RIFCSPLOWO2_01_FULL_38_20]
MTDIIESLIRKGKGYPDNLKQLSDCPERLFIKGEIKKSDNLAIAIVGTRLMTGYGKRVAWRFSYELAKVGITIVSGLARGIDTVAHEAAIAAGGRTIAVLGNGLNIVYPPENKNLFNRIIKSGAVISEFPPGTKPFGKNFLARNRIIAGLSKAVLVVEGRKKSGTLSTATYAANYGREVFAIPGPIDSPFSEAPLWLIENGARIATKPEDILDSLF